MNYEYFNADKSQENETFDFPDDGLDREEIRDSLKELGFVSANELALTAALCQRMLPTSGMDADDINEEEDSRFGGMPDVDSEFEWPRRDGRPLAFLAQIDFWSEGDRLLFFYDVTGSPNGYSPQDRGGCRVVHIESNDLVRATPPDDLPEECQFNEVQMTMFTDIVLPDFGSKILKDLNVSQKDIDLMEEMDSESDDDTPPSHHLMGHPTLWGEDMEVSLALAFNGLDPLDPKVNEDPRYREILNTADDWSLLFQCVSDPLPGFSWGNEGRLFFWIRHDDFENRNFDDVWVMKQTKPE